MSIFRKVFHKKEKVLTVKETSVELIEEPKDCKNNVDDLSFIEETLLKLELINVSHGKTEYLTEKLSFFQNQLKEIKERYLGESLSVGTLSLEFHDTKAQYLANLSILADEINSFSESYFYLEKLDFITHLEITEVNIEEHKCNLLELEKTLESYHDKNIEVDEKLQKKLIEAIEYILEKEITLTIPNDFYDRISNENRLKIEKRYFKKLLEMAKKDTYVLNYLKEKDITSLKFDYDMFSYMILGQAIPKKEIVSPVSNVAINNNLEVTILERDEILGNSKLEIFGKRGSKAAISDYAICSGGYVASNYYVGEEKLENRTGWYWTKTDDGDNDARAVSYLGDDIFDYVSYRDSGVRPALSFSSISSICRNRVRTQDGILEVEYGEYPQRAVSKELQRELERLFQRRSLSKTGKQYTRDSVKYNQYNDKFQKEIQEEYEYNGKKYVRVRVNSCYGGNKFKLSNGEEYQDGDYVWIEVSPIKWLVDERKNVAVIEKILFAGVQFKNTGNYRENFENTNLHWYLNTYFVKEMVPSNIKNLIVLRPKVKQKILDDGTNTSIRYY